LKYTFLGENETLPVISYLIGAQVIVYSDHSALKHLLEKKDAKPQMDLTVAGI
jgi:hypothetical protein